MHLTHFGILTPRRILLFTDISSGNGLLSDGAIADLCSGGGGGGGGGGGSCSSHKKPNSLDRNAQYVNHRHVFEYCAFIHCSPQSTTNRKPCSCLDALWATCVHTTIPYTTMAHFTNGFKSNSIEISFYWHFHSKSAMDAKCFMRHGGYIDAVCVKYVAMGWSVTWNTAGISYVERELRAVCFVHNGASMINMMRRVISVNDVVIMFGKWLIGDGKKAIHEHVKVIWTSRVQVTECMFKQIITWQY